MSKSKSSKKQKSQVIVSKELMIHSPGKLGRHLGQVQSGCGIKPSKKTYTRKKKHKNLVSSLVLTWGPHVVTKLDTKPQVGHTATKS